MVARATSPASTRLWSRARPKRRMPVQPRVGLALVILVCLFRTSFPLLEGKWDVELAPIVPEHLLALADARASVPLERQRLTQRRLIIMTLGDYSYRAVVMNFIVSLERLDISNYMVVTLDHELRYQYQGQSGWAVKVEGLVLN